MCLCCFRRLLEERGDDRIGPTAVDSQVQARGCVVADAVFWREGSLIVNGQELPRVQSCALLGRRDEFGQARSLCWSPRKDEVGQSPLVTWRMQRQKRVDGLMW